MRQNTPTSLAIIPAAILLALPFAVAQQKEHTERNAPGVNAPTESSAAREAILDKIGTKNTEKDAPKAKASTELPATKEGKLAQVEAEKLAQKIQNAREATQNAKKLIGVGRDLEAERILEQAHNSLPLTEATQWLIESIRKLRADIIIARAYNAVRKKDLVAIKAEIDAYQKKLGSDPQLESLKREFDRISKDPLSQNIDTVSPGFKKEASAIESLITRGQAQILYGDFEGAKSTLREVEARDPNNGTAKALLIEIESKTGKSSELNRIKTRSEMLQSVTRAWQRPRVFDLKPKQKEKAGLDPIRQRLQLIEIPEVNFPDLPLSRAIEALVELSAEYEPGNKETKKGINMFTQVDPSEDKNIRFRARFLTVDKILDFVTEQAGCTWDIQNGAVVVQKGQSDLLLETEFFAISTATTARLAGGAKSTTANTSPPTNPFAPGGGGSGNSTATVDTSSETEKALKSFFERAGVSFETQGANLAYDGSQIIVTQTSKNLEKMRTILRRYDQTKQVEIETKFIDVQQDNLDELGLSWSGERDNNNRRFTSVDISNTSRSLASAFSGSDQSSQVVIDRQNTNTSITGGGSGGGGQTTTQTGDPLPRISIDTSPPTLGGADIARIGASFLSIDGILDGFDFQVALRALERRQGTDFLTSPKVTVLSGKTARIAVGQELRYPEEYSDLEAEVGDSAAALTITGGTPSSFQTRYIGVEMEVTPQVEENENISLKLAPRVTQFEGFIAYGVPSIAITPSTTVQLPPSFYQPVFSVREVTTEVTVFDGATVVVGGLTREEVKKVNDKVPLLGDLPILGNLFRSKGESSQKKNLLIFVTANLISPGGATGRQEVTSPVPNALFQNPVIITPAGSVNRKIKR